MCKDFEAFMKGHEKRMQRAEEVGKSIKTRHDKKRRKLLGELNKMVFLFFLSCC